MNESGKTTENNGIEENQVIMSVALKPEYKEYIEQFRVRYGYQTMSNVIKLFLRVGIQIHLNSPDEFFKLVEDSSDVLQDEKY
jgi:hypothetical protein